jgi:Lrp/AsnC family transcriptional regulator for asnA, asnC and gidA
VRRRKIGLTPQDEKLIKLLQADGRQSSESLSRKLGVSPSTILRRIQQLTDDGVMRVVAVVDPDKVGLALAAVIGLDVAPGKLKSALEALAREPAVKFISATAGHFDIICFTLFASAEELSGFMEKNLAGMDGVKDSETFVCLRTRKGRFAQYTPLDRNLDERLIKLLQRDGRQSSESLARQLKVSSSTVMRRIRKLTAEGTMQIVAAVDMFKLGWPVVAVLGLDVEPGALVKVMDALAKEDAVKFVSSTTGRYDVMAFMRFRSNEDLSAFTEKVLAGLDGVKDSETFLCLDIKRGRYTQV